MQPSPRPPRPTQRSPRLPSPRLPSPRQPGSRSGVPVRILQRRRLPGCGIEDRDRAGACAGSRLDELVEGLVRVRGRSDLRAADADLSGGEEIHQPHADGTGSRARLRAGREHQRALDLVGRPLRVQREQIRSRARDDRRRERRARELHVAGRDHASRGGSAASVESPGTGPTRERPGRCDLGLGEAVVRVAPRRPRRRDVVVVPTVLPRSIGADGDHERVVAGGDSRTPLGVGPVP